MAVEHSPMRSGNHDASSPLQTPTSCPGARPRHLGNAFRMTTRRFQVKSFLARLTLDRHTAMMAVKASIPPTILLCAIQSSTWINTFQTQAYLAAITSACVMPTLPRARLIEYNFQFALALVLSYCWVLLGGWCGLQARKHTTSTPEELVAYNSSAETIAAMFLIFWTWCTFTIKSAFPFLAIQSTWACIFVVVASPVVAPAASLQELIADATSVLEVMLTGQAVGFVNALIVFPQSCRGTFRKDMRACLDGLVAVMRAQKRCIEDFRTKSIPAEGDDERDFSVRQLQSVLDPFISSIVKARTDVEYAEREVAWDRFGHSELKHISSLLVELIPPASGLGSAADMLQQVIDRYRSSDNAGEATDSAETGDNLKAEEYWHSLEDKMHEQSSTIAHSIIEGAEHAKILLGLADGRPLFSRARASGADEENQEPSISPGKTAFLESYRDIFGQCCVLGHDTDDSDGERLLDHYVHHRPQVEDLSQITPGAHLNTLRYFLLLHVSS